MVSRVNPGLRREIAKLGTDELGNSEFNAEACFNCGTCTALCPLGYQILPRKLFHEVRLGLEDKIRASIPQIFSCLLCRMCEENCPQGVKITENMRILRHMINRQEFGLK
ncbi:MAG: 4Fe-4S dicluster domain-containing protein [Alphaproteobacteria bacterium]|nr:4Fe-4S dicluster domain-containing protein [Alphaproteobacteria bacterium]MDE1985954.1 4Fe-4S dicluster domain-containing protein [Alphaproteobacteria bacterium]MDE2163367.1 4Fe-4S dicluster domain-containing protein [Alphaproteobacteria bacterium]MDE2267285.1 4Fe-4S dicluster domain-containing protein [Alphaproteobacteria bacterium]MDE2500570.1 4Fe-4S dicluster domain-containing protein [Alphaproteobacteria bacterium]